jgi:EAL domain-containing protein (putative c-di-GMP-specific phosphodiesterase class I)
MGISVVAEGVETTEQLEMLRQMECVAAQGFLLGPPGSPDTLGPALAHRPAAGSGNG